MVEENGNLKLLSQHQVSRQALREVGLLKIPCHLNCTILELLSLGEGETAVNPKKILG
jgi:hypothetical protein